MGLYPILNEKVVALDSETDVVLYSQVVNSVDGDNSGKRVMHCYSSGEGSGDVSGHVEVGAISAEDLRLSAVHELGVGDMSFETVDALARQHQVRAILFH